MIWRSVFDLSGQNYVEFLFRNESILVNVSPVDKFIDLLIRDDFSDFSGNPSEVFGGDEAGPFVVEEGKDFVDVGAGVLVVDSFGHEGEPLCEIDGAVSVGV